MGEKYRLFILKCKIFIMSLLFTRIYYHFSGINALYLSKGVERGRNKRKSVNIRFSQRNVQYVRY